MEQRISSPENENTPKLSPRRQRIAALVYVLFCIFGIAVVVWFKV
ncbi:hypothetical protein X757_07880 [Mesorhizobium sp. LSHC414A00]|nr:hypothetical protein X757_07880 [Mesorhizobium sp. LSHC414A00]